MKTEIEDAIKLILERTADAAKDKEVLAGNEVLKLTQAALNLSHVRAVMMQVNHGINENTTISKRN